MTDKLTEVLMDQQISEPEIIELISSYRKLVKVGVLTEESFTTLLFNLGVKTLTENEFTIDEDTVYTLN
jgi:hypothetical protein